MIRSVAALAQLRASTARLWIAAGAVLIGKFLRSGLKLVNQVAYPLRKRLGDGGIEPAVKPFGQEIREIRRVGSAPCTADAETRKLSPLPDHRDK